MRTLDQLVYSCQDAEMTQRPLSTKERLIRAASELFRSRGYSGVGVAEILSAAEAPKGSLYHHFPQGKSDLAIAAATWASDGMLQIIAASFENAQSFSDGATTLCHKLAKLFDRTGWNSCPIEGILSDGPANIEFSEMLLKLYNGWLAEIEHHAARLGSDPDDAKKKADELFILFQGGWNLARARNDSNVLRQLPITDQIR